MRVESDFVCEAVDQHFPSFSEGLSLRVRFAEHALTSQRRFPFLFGRAFIEVVARLRTLSTQFHFPSFLEGLSLRPCRVGGCGA